MSAYSPRERHALEIRERGAPLAQIARVLGASEVDARDWLESHAELAGFFPGDPPEPLAPSVAPRRHSRSTPTLESLRAIHDRLPINRGVQIQARIRARKLAESLGVAVPEWARAQRSGCFGPPPKSKTQASAAPGAGLSSLEIPAELRAWRLRVEGAIVQVSSTRGVVLHAFGVKPRRFASVDEAIDYARTG